MRWCAFWAQEAGAGFEAFSCLERGGTYLVIHCGFGRDEALASLAPIYPAADRPERHAHDLLGIRFSDQPDPRRWTRHHAWNDVQFPLRADFQWSPPEAPTPPDCEYPFVQAHGPGIVEIPVGPVHAGIIEPGHFRFQAMGEIILNLEERLGYVHKGIEKIAVGRDAEGLARLAGRVSGDCTVGHAWAACQAMERAAGIEVTPRALWLRALMAERERVANHLGDIGAICNDVAFAFGYYQLTRLREGWVRESAAVFGHRLLMDRVIPGGTAADISDADARRMIDSARALRREAAEIVRILEDSESLEDRLMRTGRLAPELAAELGAVGYVGKASGQVFDVRADAPYAPYDQLEVRVPHYRAGDVAARAKVRSEEIDISLELITRILDSPPDGPYATGWRAPQRACEGMGMVDGWRGEILCYLRFDDDGRIARYFPRDPSWLTWPALEQCVQGNIVPDFPVCNKSINGSYSGHDL
ncbi:MAG: NADH-quinone oxidoreductase subunit C [Gammaproteobacteria bacterium]|nr:NADH-quinone oxidoreductase subunit C [Gammaproteobacteria bacterium]